MFKFYAKSGFGYSKIVEQANKAVTLAYCYDSPFQPPTDDARYESEALHYFLVRIWGQPENFDGFLFEDYEAVTVLWALSHHYIALELYDLAARVHDEALWRTCVHYIETVKSPFDDAHDLRNALRAIGCDELWFAFSPQHLESQEAFSVYIESVKPQLYNVIKLAS